MLFLLNSSQSSGSILLMGSQGSGIIRVLQKQISSEVRLFQDLILLVGMLYCRESPSRVSPQVTVCTIYFTCSFSQGSLLVYGRGCVCWGCDGQSQWSWWSGQSGQSWEGSLISCSSMSLWFYSSGMLITLNRLLLQTSTRIAQQRHIGQLITSLQKQCLLRKCVVIGRASSVVWPDDLIHVPVATLVTHIGHEPANCVRECHSCHPWNPVRVPAEGDAVLQKPMLHTRRSPEPHLLQSLGEIVEPFHGGLPVVFDVLSVDVATTADTRGSILAWRCGAVGADDVVQTVPVVLGLDHEEGCLQVFGVDAKLHAPEVVVQLLNTVGHGHWSFLVHQGVDGITGVLEGLLSTLGVHIAVEEQPAIRNGIYILTLRVLIDVVAISEGGYSSRGLPCQDNLVGFEEVVGVVEVLEVLHCVVHSPQVQQCIPEDNGLKA